MEIKKPDRRILKTKKAIRNAFADLLSKKDINDITIKDIADTADINRKTFYNYYSGIYQVIDEIENEIITAFEEDLVDFNFRESEQPLTSIFSKLTAIIDNDIELYSSLMRADVSSNLITKLVATLREKAIVFFVSKHKEDVETIRIISDYTISGIFAVYQSWFNSDYKMPIENLTKITNDIMMNGIKNYILE